MLAIWSLVPRPFLKPAWNLLSHQESPHRSLNIINVTPAFRGYSKFSWKMFRPQRAKEEVSLKKKKKISSFSPPVCNNAAFEIVKMEKEKDNTQIDLSTSLWVWRVCRKHTFCHFGSYAILNLLAFPEFWWKISDFLYIPNAVYLLWLQITKYWDRLPRKLWTFYSGWT